MTEVYGWHFARTDRTLRYKDGRKFRKGQTLKVDGKPVLCEWGLHASPKALDALSYAPGPIACYVRLSGEIVVPNAEHPDKMAATGRTVIAWVDATPILRDFIRDTLAYRQPHIVSLFKKANLPEHAYAIEQLQMGTASFADIRAVFDAAWDAARGAAWDAAWDAALGAARGASRDDLNAMLEARLFAAMGITK